MVDQSGYAHTHEEKALVTSSTRLTELDIRERLARIDQLAAEAALKRKKFELGYRRFWAAAVAAGALLMAVGGAVGALLTQQLIGAH